MNVQSCAGQRLVDGYALSPDARGLLGRAILGV